MITTLWPLLVGVVGGLLLGAVIISYSAHPLRRRSDDPLAGERCGR